jgi:cell shape-determining protein MreD
MMHESLFDITFSINHIIAELFWNAVFALILFGFSKAKVLSKIHKYVDNKHGVEHHPEDY